MSPFSNCPLLMPLGFKTQEQHIIMRLHAGGEVGLCWWNGSRVREEGEAGKETQPDTVIAGSHHHPPWIRSSKAHMRRWRTWRQIPFKSSVFTYPAGSYGDLLGGRARKVEFYVTTLPWSLASPFSFQAWCSCLWGEVCGRQQAVLHLFLVPTR